MIWGAGRGSGSNDATADICGATGTADCIAITPWGERSARRVPESDITRTRLCHHTRPDPCSDGPRPVGTNCRIGSAESPLHILRFPHGSCLALVGTIPAAQRADEPAEQSHVIVRRDEHRDQRPDRAVQRVQQHQRQRREQPDRRLQAGGHQLHRLPDHQHRHRERFRRRGRHARLRQQRAGHHHADRQSARSRVLPARASSLSRSRAAR